MSSYIYHVRVSTSSVTFLCVSHFKLLESVDFLNAIFDFCVAWQWVETLLCYSTSTLMCATDVPFITPVLFSLSNAHCVFHCCFIWPLFLDSGYSAELQIHLLLKIYILLKILTTSIVLSDINSDNKYMLPCFCTHSSLDSSVKVPFSKKKKKYFERERERARGGTVREERENPKQPPPYQHRA